MFHRCLAALLLLPASFVVFGSLRAWCRAASSGVYYFFSRVVKEAPGLVGSSGCWLHRIFLYYPMRLGLELVKRQSLRATLAQNPDFEAARQSLEEIALIRAKGSQRSTS